jgi:hypothetical protein
MTEGDTLSAPRKLTHHQARMEQLLYWSRKSIPERLAAATALTARMYSMRGVDINDFETDFTPRRVHRMSTQAGRMRHLADAEELALIPDAPEPQ